MNSNSLPLVSIIIPVRNGARSIQKLIQALQRQSYPKNFLEILVIDDASTDGILQTMSKLGLNSFRTVSSQGSYACRNLGARIARGELLAFIDSDCIPTDLWIEEFVSTIQQTHADLVGGRIVFSFSHAPTAAEIFDSICFLQQKECVLTRGSAVTANLLVKKKVFEALGGFQADLRSGADLIFASKAVAQGYQLDFSDGAFVVHPARSWIELLFKSFRVGSGKADVLALDPTQPRLISSFSSYPQLRYLRPAHLKKRLREEGRTAHFFPFTQIWAVTLLVFFVSALGYLWRRFNRLFF